jgi:hypothetical protein
MAPDDTAGDMWFRLLAAAGKARHPSLSLARFVADVDTLPKDGHFSDDDVPSGERESARLRRAALIVAAMDVVDRCIDDLQSNEFGDGQLPDAEDAKDSFVYEWFPQRHRRTYDEGFFRKVMVTAVQVAADLANPEGSDASCTAEEIVRHAVGTIAGEICEAAGLGEPWISPDEYLLEDTDFEFLYSEDTDGLEDDPGAQAAIGIEVLPPRDWFAPFNDSRVVHPYAETPSSTASLHDLYQRLGPNDGPHDSLADHITDASEPIASMAAGSEIVALARQTATSSVDGRWIPDDVGREASFAALVLAAAPCRGSGWLDWEPYDGAGSVRAEPVIQLTPHRHFPFGDDEPWVDAAIGHGRSLAIPLRFVVSYRADPNVRERRERTFSDLMP